MIGNLFNQKVQDKVRLGIYFTEQAKIRLGIYFTEQAWGFILLKMLK